MRQQAASALQPILNAFPVQNGLDYGTAANPSLAEFIEASSLPSTINSTSVRIDQKLGSKSTAFSDTQTHLHKPFTFSINASDEWVDAQTYTAGLTSQFSQTLSNEFRFGYARSHSFNDINLDSFGGATPINLSQTMGNGYSSTSQSEFDLNFSSIGYPALYTQTGGNLGRQWNVVDSVKSNMG